MTRIEELEQELRARLRTFVVTGAAGSICGNLLERLLELGQEVVELDPFVTGTRENLIGRSPLCRPPPPARATACSKPILAIPPPALKPARGSK